MAMTMTTEGMGELGETLRNLGDQAVAVASKGLYAGAGKMADRYTNATKQIVTEKFHYLARPDLAGVMRYPSPEEKAALMGKSGIANFRNDADGVDTIVGISRKAGYAMVNGKKKAVLLIARSINSGTSFMHPQPVYKKAASGGRKEAQQAIIEQIESELGKIVNGNNG